MLHSPIRLINNGDTLDEINLNRIAQDAQTNFEEVFRILNELVAGSATPDLVPETIVERDANGTAKFGEPTELEHPVRLADTNKLFPRGLVVMWSGAINEVPAGWALCNGSNGTPKMVDRFVVGAGGEYAVGATGGAKEVSLTIAQMPRHGHGGRTTGDGDGGHTHTYTKPVWGPEAGREDRAGPTGITSAQTSVSGGDHTHNLSIDPTGDNQPHENRPPYYAIAYIMKL